MRQWFTPRLIIGLLLGGLVLMLVLFALWLLPRIERVTEEKYVGYQGEARYNPLLAAQRLLEKMQVEVKAVHRLPKIDHSLQQADVLLLVQGHRPLTDRQSEALLAWVAHGGHVLLVSSTLHNQEANIADPTLDRLQVEQWRLELDDEAILNADPVAIELPAQERPFQVNFHADYVLKAPVAEAPQASEIEIHQLTEQTHLLHLQHGTGHVTLLSDVWFLHNARIGELDHAPFFWALLNLQQAPQRVWLVYPLSQGLVDTRGIRRKPSQGSYCEDCEDADFAGSDTPSLWGILWDKAWYLIISLLLLLWLALWLASRRFGGLLPAPSEQRRSLLEHIEASGEFLWQHQQSHQLLRGLRHNVFKDLQRHYPDWLKLSHAETSQRVGEHCGIAPDQVQQALYHVKLTSASSFTEAVQCLKHIRRAL